MRTRFSVAFIFVNCLIFIGMHAHSQEDTQAVTPATTHELKTTYSISSNTATTTTLVKKASEEKEKLLRGYLFETIATKLKSLPMVSGVEFDDEVEGQISGSTYSDYWELKRSYPAMIQLALPSSVTLMVRVEETYRKCKSPAEKAALLTTPASGGYAAHHEDDFTGDTLDCKLASSVKIKGPYAVYGNFASSLNVERLMKEKQTISFELARDTSDKTSLKLDSRFVIDSEQFERSLFKFLEAFNLKIPKVEGDVFAVSGSSTNGSVYTRSNILLGIARIMRVNNERIVE